MISVKQLILQPFRILLIIVSATIVLLFLSVSSVYSQTSSPAPSSGGSVFNLEFPVKDLGGCKNLDECTNYCSDPTHYNSCTDFAKKQGFYKDDPITYDQDLLGSAKEELGCDSKDSCLDFCSKVENQASCDAWSKRNDIPGGYTAEPEKPEYIEKAKEVLGCDSAQSCSTFCDNQSNSDKCSEFADQVGLLGGNVKEGPGGCQTPETCSAFCSDPANFEQCKNDSDGNFAGSRRLQQRRVL